MIMDSSTQIVIMNMLNQIIKELMIMFRVFKQLDDRNRAYVVDQKGNKLFYGTVYQCRKFISYMEGDNNDERSIEGCAVRERENRD